MWGAPVRHSPAEAGWLPQAVPAAVHRLPDEPALRRAPRALRVGAEVVLGGWEGHLGLLWSVEEPSFVPEAGRHIGRLPGCLPQMVHGVLQVARLAATLPNAQRGDHGPEPGQGQTLTSYPNDQWSWHRSDPRVDGQRVRHLWSFDYEPTPGWRSSASED